METQGSASQSSRKSWPINHNFSANQHGELDQSSKSNQLETVIGKGGRRDVSGGL